MDFRTLNGLVQDAVLAAFEESDIAQYRVAGAGSAFDVRGMFEAEYLDVNAGEVAVESAGPAFHTKRSEFDQYDITPRRDDDIAISGTTYIVVNVRPDGRGWVVLILEEA